MENVTARKETVAAGYARPEVGESRRKAQGCFLSELPGVALGIVTLTWILVSFAGLVWATPPVAMFHQAAQMTYQHVPFISGAAGAISRAPQVINMTKRLLGFGASRQD